MPAHILLIQLTDLSVFRRSTRSSTIRFGSEDIGAVYSVLYGAVLWARGISRYVWTAYWDEADGAGTIRFGVGLSSRLGNGEY
jgi:hypothetical protein